MTQRPFPAGRSLAVWVADRHAGEARSGGAPPAFTIRESRLAKRRGLLLLGAAILSVLAVLAAATSPAAGQTPQAPPHPQPPAASAVDEAGVAALVRRLGDPSYDVRTRATRRLCALGHRAAPALVQAAAGEEFEVALRSQNILDLLDSLYFGGCSVTLAADRSRTAWDAPVELTVTFRNQSGYRAFLPVDRRAPAADEPRQAAARQVGDLIDLADYLRVTGPGGEPIAPRVDDIRADPLVAEAIEWRAEGGPVAELPPGGELVVRLPAFNRGWARYPLLEAGAHRVVFDYHPQWDDAVFREQEVGRVTSEPVAIEVTAAAPPAVRNGRQTATVSVGREGDELIARLTNHDDLPIRVNTNWGDRAPPLAALVWSVVTAGDIVELNPTRTGPLPGESGFSRNRVIDVAPGASIELGRIGLKRVLASAAVERLAGGTAFEVAAALVNQCDLCWQRAHTPPLLNHPRAPAGLRTPLPRRMITGHLTGSGCRLVKP